MWSRVATVALIGACSTSAPVTKEQLGKLLFTDPNLSQPAGQACADCHALALAFRDPESSHTTSMGVVTGRFGARNSPTAMYARYIPPLHREGERWIGGLFWDGRANTLEEQAAGPLLNPLEMNNPDKATVVDHARRAAYARAFVDVYGAYALDDIDVAFARIGDAIAAFERSPELSPFNSKYDRYAAGQATLTNQELRGLEIFEDPQRGNCARCHPAPLFTDFSYANLGVPRYANNMFYRQPPAYNPEGESFVDHGLAAITKRAEDDGKFRVPTLRNIARTNAYSHNGYFDNLPFMLDFLNSRDVGSRDAPTCSRIGDVRCAWPAPEIPATIESPGFAGARSVAEGRRGETIEPGIGHLGLAEQDLADLAAFLATLTDEPL